MPDSEHSFGCRDGSCIAQTLWASHSGWKYAVRTEWVQRSLKGHKLWVKDLNRVDWNVFFYDMTFPGALYALFVLFSQIAIIWLKARIVLKQRLRTGKGSVAGFYWTYKELLVWGNLMNSCISERRMGFLMLVTPLLQIVSFCGLILSKSLLPTVQMGLFALLAIEAPIFNVFLLTAAGYTNKSSRVWLQRQKESKEGKKMLWRKTVAAMQPVKVHFGSNYVDPLTPLAVENFCWSSTASLVLLRRSRRWLKALLETCVVTCFVQFFKHKFLFGFFSFRIRKINRLVTFTHRIAKLIRPDRVWISNRE